MAGTAQEQPQITFSSGRIVNSDCEIEMLCHDKLLTHVDSLDCAGKKWSTLGSKNTASTSTMKRTLKDAKGDLVMIW